MLSIDITDTQIKLVEAVVSGKITVKRAASRDLPTGCIENGRIIDMHIVAGEITDILVTEGISDREAVICINSGLILYKEIEIPKPKAGSETFVVQSIIQNEMSLGDEYNITYTISEEIYTDEGYKLKVIAAACPQTMIDIYLELARQVGLKCKLIVVSNSCITRLIMKSTVYKDLSPLLLLQVDKNFINISLYNKGALIFSRHTKIDASDYENNPDYVNLAIFDNVFRTMHLLEQNELADQIKDIHYFGAVKDAKALQLTLQQLNLTARELAFPVDIIKKKSFAFGEFANVIGSLLKVDLKTENINLLNTKSQRIKSMNLKFAVTALVTAGVCGGVVLGAWLFTNIITNTKESELAILDATYESKRSNEMTIYVAEMEAAVGKFETYADMVDTAKILFEFQPKMTSEIVEHITRDFLPGMAILEDFTVDEYTLFVRFRCTDESHPAVFTERLIESGYFEDVRFYGYSSSEDGGYTFYLNMRIKGGNIFES
ncbi:MAG: pilus assembly protein PilM [Oscillospiraceae bacterium]|nr:pilus assembly protein PilM [Oscillospiraceae bacterium]